MSMRLRRLSASALVVALVAAAVSVLPFASPAAQAAGSPNLTVTRDVAATTLYGDDVAVTLTAKNPSGPDGFNLTFTDVLPKNATIGTATPAPDQQLVQADGTTILVWSNVSDLQTGTTGSVTYTVHTPQASFAIGAVVGGTANAYVNVNERIVPTVSPTGVVSNASGSGTAVASSSKLVPFTLDKILETSPENEILRGVHDHKQVYKLVITNNKLVGSDTFSIDDYLPADLEFLGCTDVDNSAAGTTEYAGAGRIDATAFPTLTNCLPGTSTLTTSTVTLDPDGANTTLANGVYTKATWSGLPAIAAGSSLSIEYAAAVPLRENVQAAGPATANLDNNTGALTSDEEPVVNYATASGRTNGTGYTVGGYAKATAEDVAIQKSVDTDLIAHDATSTWTLDVESSEYTTKTGAITVTDTIPDGLEFTTTTTGPTGTAVTNGDGTQTVTWTLLPGGFTAKNGIAKIVYTTKTLTTYRHGGGPVASEDSWTNTVHLATTATDITDAAAATADLPVIDDSQAGQHAVPITMDKEVAEPQASVAADCSTAGLNWQQDATGATHGSYRQGDTVCWRLTVNFPGGLNTLNTRVRDILPPGFTFVQARATAANDVSSKGEDPTNGGPSATASGPADNTTGAIRWYVDNASSGTTFQWIVTSVWSDASASAPGVVQGNLMKLRWTNTPGSVFQLRDLADVQLAKPVLGITKSASPTQAVAGQAVAYTITVSNTGNTDAINAKVTDTLPTGWTCADISTAGCAAGVVTFTGVSVVKGGSTVLTVNGTVPADAGSADKYTDTAAIVSFQTPTNTGGATTYTSTATATAAVTVPKVTLTKTASPANVREGETVTYTLTGKILANTSLYNAPKVTDTVPTGLVVQAATLTVGGTTMPAPTVAGRTVTAPVTTGGADFAARATDTAVVLTITATLPSASGINASSTLKNTGAFTWSGSSAAGGVAQTTTSNQTTQTVIEPVLGITKADNRSQTAKPGDIVTFTLNAGNSGTASSYDSTVRDLVPAELQPLKADGTGVTTTGDIVDTTGSSAGVVGTWDQSARTITFIDGTGGVSTIDAGVSATVMYRAQVMNPLVSHGSITNTATITGTSMPGTVTGERTSYAATASDTLQNPQIVLGKSASRATATIGQKIAYTITATIPAGTTSYDATLVDALPAHVQWVSTDGVTCANADATACSIGAATIGSPQPSDTTVGYFLGDIAASTQQRVVTIVYTGIVRTTAVRDETLSNTVTLRFDTTHKVGATPSSIPAAFDVTGGSATANVAEVEPRLGIAKAVAGGSTGLGTAASPMRATPGTALVYTVTVGNTGSGAAYAVSVKDPLPTLTPCGTVTGISDGGTCTAGVLSWTLPSLASGASKVLSYTVTVPANLTSTAENPAAAELVNVADVPSYDGLDATDPANTGLTPKHYTEDPQAEADVELDLASLGGTLWQEWATTGATVGTLDADDPRLAGIPITVTYLGADGVAGGGDDEVHHTTTGSDGTYLVANLPGGGYTVTVDASTLVARGLTPAYDADGVTTANLWSGSLAQDQDRRRVDFSFQGTGSIGDTVWFDRDRDGAQNGTEPGLRGVTVTLSTVIDGATLTATTTTDAAGRYLFGTLPAGSYTVTVTDPGSGLSIVTDPQGPKDGSSAVALAAGANDLAQDFGYAGTGSLGDRIWLDRDKDGVQGADEPGLVGVTVAVTWQGQDGILGNGDDIVFTTTTAADGAYTVDGLPAGTYAVRVTGGLPGGATATYDLDGTGTADSAVAALGNGQNRTDIDFGYSAETQIGDVVWWDADHDGAQDPGEPGLPGVPVTVVYAGQNGIFGDADDITYHATTNALGRYLVDKISQGHYRVTVTPPTGFAPTGDADSPAGSGDNTSATTIGAGGDLTQDFGYAGAGTIGDTVWLDQDGDHAQGAGEPGIPGVVVKLTTIVNGTTVTRTTTTDANGHYAFGGVPFGAYTVGVDTTSLPSGLTATAANITTILGAATPSDDTLDFGFRGSASLGDTVWFDRDGDGVQGPTEPGLGGVTVTGVWTDGVQTMTVTTTTAADGTYTLSGLPAGTWTVTASGLPAGFSPTYDQDGTADGVDHYGALAIGENKRDADLGFRGTASIGSVVWLDLDGDGTRDAGEPGVPGQRVDVTWAGPNGVLGDADDQTFTTTTAADGGYLVDHLPDGPYRVTVVHGIADAAANTGDPDPGADATSALMITGGASNLVQDFGFQGANELGDTVWWDRDGDGTQNGAESGFPNATVEIRWFGPDGASGTADDIVLTRTTDAAGGYDGTGLPDGDYRVRVTGGIPAGFASTVDAHDATPDASSTVTLGATHRQDLGLDFGYQGTGALGNVVWLDEDGDGTRDAGEPGIPGATVTVVWAGPDGTVGGADDVTFTTTTDAHGAWTVDELPAGSYTVTVSGTPTGMANTGDPDHDGDSTTTVPLASGGTATADFGYRGSASAGDQVWLDVDGDGVRGAFEPGVSGLPITVRMAGVDGVLDTADDIVATVTTDADGTYLVTGMPNGPTRVSYDRADLPAGQEPSSDLDDDKVDGDAAGTTFVLGLAEDKRDVDFVVIGTSSLSGVVFDDANADGVQNPGERGVGGVAIVVVWNSAKGPIPIQVTSAADGSWSLPHVPAGSYALSEDSTTFPAGFHPSTVTERSVTVPAGGTAQVVFGISTALLAATGMTIAPWWPGAAVLLLLGIAAVLWSVRRRRMGAGPIRA